MPALMVQGCTSWAGKSLLVTALCRWFARRGIQVVPFKAQNMSNNARVVDGGEIGVAQWLQARAAGVQPDVRMNPVLVKPEAGSSQVVVLGRVDHQLSRTPWPQRSQRLWPVVDQALGDLLAASELVVIEGAGSPAEINLRGCDIANMRVAERAAAPVLLVADIDRGGAFAHLYGTWALLPEGQRRLIGGYVLNRFRGDATLLPPGPRILEHLTGIPTLGVLPMLDHDLPDEDGAGMHAPRRGDRPPVAIVRYPTASNLDEFTLLEQVAEVRWATRPFDLLAAAVVVLPGSKHVAADATWLHASGLADAVRRTATTTPVVGICGGLQLLGHRFDDPAGVDGSGQGLGLLPVTTTFHRDKRQQRVTATFTPDLSGPWAPLAGRTVRGYEIRHGHTRPLPSADHVGAAAGRSGATQSLPDGRAVRFVEVLPDGLGYASGGVLGVYLHGLFEDPDVLAALFGSRPDRTLESTFDLLADAVAAQLDTDRLLELAGTP